MCPSGLASNVGGVKSSSQGRQQPLSRFDGLRASDRIESSNEVTLNNSWLLRGIHEKDVRRRVWNYCNLPWLSVTTACVGLCVGHLSEPSRMAELLASCQTNTGPGEVEVRCILYTVLPSPMACCHSC